MQADDDGGDVSRELLLAKFAAQLCSAAVSSFLGQHHVCAVLWPQRTPAVPASVSRTSQLTPSQLHQRRTQRVSANTAGSNSQTSASDLANSRHLLQPQHALTPQHVLTPPTLLEARPAPPPRRHLRRARTRSTPPPPRAAASTRILRAACFSDMAFSITGAIVTGVELFAPSHSSNFQLLFWAKAPHWSAQIASFLWMATLGMYIAKRTNRAAFDVAIAHAIIWLLVLFYFVLELYALYYKRDVLLTTAKIVWKVLAVACIVVVAASWSVFANRWRQQTRRRGALVLSKLLAYAIAFFVFVSPTVVVDLVRGIDAASNDATAACATLLALWPTANVVIYITKQSCLLHFFQRHQHKRTTRGAADSTAGGRNRGGTDVVSLQSSGRRANNNNNNNDNHNANGPLLLSPNSHELKGLVIGDKIGEGIAVVYAGTWRGANVAVKMKSLQLESAEVLVEFQHACNLEIQAEAEIMKGLCHPNIVLFMEAGFYRGSICIISEFCARGSLRDVLMRANVQHLSWPTKLRLALGICHGIQYLHNAHPPMIHRDLKSPNVLVDSSWHAKIADFGTLRLAEIVSNVQQTASSFVGTGIGIGIGDSNRQGGAKPTERTTPAVGDMTGLVGTTRWMAPEVIRGDKSYSSKVDIYSLALILWELIEGKLPFESTRWNHEIEDFVLQGMRPVVRDELCPMRWKMLILQCWQPDPVKRPTIQQVISSLQRIARDEVWDTTAPRFTGVSSQFSATQSSMLSHASFVSSTVSASYMDSPPSMLGSTMSSLLRGSSITTTGSSGPLGPLGLGNNTSTRGGAGGATMRRTQWSRLSDTLEEQQQQFAADAGDSDTNSASASRADDDEFSSSITIIEPASPDDDAFPNLRQHPAKTQATWQPLLGRGGKYLNSREMELSLSDLDIGSSFISIDSSVASSSDSDVEVESFISSTSNHDNNVGAIMEASSSGDYTITI